MTPVNKNNQNQLFVRFARSRFEFEKPIPKSLTMVYGVWETILYFSIKITPENSSSFRVCTATVNRTKNKQYFKDK